jgi:K+-transporting ATPase c subunit
METWKQITGFNYKVSESGKVRSNRTGKLIKPYKCNGYIRFDLYKNSKRRKVYGHQLVAEEFHTLSYFIGAIVNHKDGNKENNYYQNLEWSTYSANNEHAYKVLGKKRIRPSGEKSCHAIRIIQLTMNNEIVNEFGSIIDAQRKYGQTIERCLSGKNKTAYGFKWKYA